MSIKKRIEVLEDEINQLKKKITDLELQLSSQSKNIIEDRIHITELYPTK